MFIRLKFEPRDMWIGVYWSVWEIGYTFQYDVYICIVPMLPVHIHWSKRLPDE